MKIKRGSLMILFAYIIFIGFFLFWLPSSKDTLSINGYENEIFPWVLISFILQFVSFVFIKKVKFFDFGLWFILLSYPFMFGYVFFSALNLDTTLLWKPGAAYSVETLYRSSIFALLVLLAFGLGYLLVYENHENVIVNEKSYSNGMIFSVGLIIFIIGFLSNFLTSMRVVSATQAAGSYSAYSNVSTSGVVATLAYLMVPGIVFIIYSHKCSKTSENILVLGAIVYFILMMSLSGSRKTQIFSIFILVISTLVLKQNDKDKKKFGFLTYAFLLLGGLLFLDLLYVIRTYRMNLPLIIPNFFESLTNFSFVGKLIGETFAETGLTFYSVASIVTCVPSVFPYELGATLFKSLPSILPIGQIASDLFNSASSTTVINQYLRVPVGASLIGDLYWNFGMIGGIIIALIIGIIAAKIFKSLYQKSLITYFSVFYIVIIGVRAGIFELTRPLAYVLIIPAILFLILNRISNKRRAQ